MKNVCALVSILIVFFSSKIASFSVCRPSVGKKNHGTARRVPGLVDGAARDLRRRLVDVDVGVGTGNERRRRRRGRRRRRRDADLHGPVGRARRGWAASGRRGGPAQRLHQPGTGQHPSAIVGAEILRQDG